MEQKRGFKMAKVFMGLVGTALLAIGGIGFFYPFAGMLDLTVTHNIMHLLTGMIAILVSSSEKYSALYARVFGFVYLALAVVGLFTHNFLGLLMLDMDDTIIHFVFAILALYIGFRTPITQSQKNAVTKVN
jgi:uncharacterized membrane protein HdeD (DUF308 family)